MPARRTDRPYFDAWLRRTHRQLAASGRLSQIALVLSGEDGDTPDAWRIRLRNLLDGHEPPSLDLLTRIDHLLAAAPDSPTASEGHAETTQDQFLLE